jgi:hypothetical protein
MIDHDIRTEKKHRPQFGWGWGLDFHEFRKCQYSKNGKRNSGFSLFLIFHPEILNITVNSARVQAQKK